MRKNNKDLVPIMASSGEQIASNPALELMGRDVIPYFNNLALKAKEQDMKPHNYANGTTKRGGIQMPELKKKKTDEKERIHNAKEERQEGFGAYANGTVTASGLQLPRLGSALDAGNSINTPPGQIPGVIRNGNSYSQAPGFVPTQTLSAPPPTGVRTGYSDPIQGFANGTGLPDGIQRVGNSYSKTNFSNTQSGRPDPYRQQPITNAVQSMPQLPQLPQPVAQQPDYYDSMQSKVKGLRGLMTGYADGTQDEYGIRPLQQPGLLDIASGLFSSDDQPQPQVSEPQPLAPTLEQSKMNYELQPRKEVVGYADGTTFEGGVQKFATGGTVRNPDLIDRITGVSPRQYPSLPLYTTNELGQAVSPESIGQTQPNYIQQGREMIPTGTGNIPPVREGIAVKDSFFRQPQQPNFTMPENYTGSIRPGQQVADIGSPVIRPPGKGLMAVPQPKPQFDSFTKPNFTPGASPEAKAYANRAAYETMPGASSSGGGIASKVFGGLGALGAAAGIAGVAAEESGNDKYLRLLASQGNESARKIINNGGVNPIANSAKDVVNRSLASAGDYIQGLGGKALDAAYNNGGSALDMGSYRQAVESPQQYADAQPIAQQAAPQTAEQPTGSTMTDRGGLRTLAGDGYSISSGAKGMGVFSTPKSLAALDRTIAYNKTQGAKDQLAANAALSQSRYDAARQAAGNSFQQPQQNFDYPQQVDYQGQIQDQIDSLNRPTSSIGGFDRMIADKKSRQNAQAGLAALLNLQKGNQDTGIDYARMAQQGNQFGQELGFKQQQQSFANQLGLGELAAKNSMAQIEQQDKDRRFSLDQSKADSEKARLDQTKYGIVKDPITNEQSIAPLSGPQADIAYEVQAGFGQRDKHPEYKAVVDKFGQAKADQMYLSKLRQDAVRRAQEKQGKK
jgi:hypothetical protein